MAKNTAAKRREAVTRDEQERLAALELAERQKAAASVRGLLAGAAVSMLFLWLLQWGPAQLWAPWEESSARAALAFAASAIAGAITATWLGRGTQAGLPAASCALGWGLTATLQHISAQGQYLDILKPHLDIEGNFQRQAMEMFTTHTLSQPLLAGFGLLVATAAGCVARRLLTKSETSGTAVRRAGNAAPALASQLLAGFVLAWCFGWFLWWRLPAPRLNDLPRPIAPAVMCAIVSLLAFGTAGYQLGRWPRFSMGALSFVAAPLAVSLAGLLLLQGGARLELPVLSLIMNSSPFEMACWGSFGLAGGLMLRDLNREPE